MFGLYSKAIVIYIRGYATWFSEITEVELYEITVNNDASIELTIHRLFLHTRRQIRLLADCLFPKGVEHKILESLQHSWFGEPLWKIGFLKPSVVLVVIASHPFSSVASCSQIYCAHYIIPLRWPKNEWHDTQHLFYTQLSWMSTALKFCQYPFIFTHNYSCQHLLFLHIFLKLNICLHLFYFVHNIFYFEIKRFDKHTPLSLYL